MWKIRMFVREETKRSTRLSASFNLLVKIKKIN